MNLLHFVALEAQKKDEKLLEFSVKLKHVQPAARVSVETLDAELQWLTSRTRSVEESVQRDTELLQQLDAFLQGATSSLCSVRGSRQQLKREGSELIDFFCEDRETFRLDDCFSIFHHFCIKFNTAVKENMEREVKEAARRRRLRELEEQKRHSWAGGEEVGGAFGLRCSSETDMDAAVSRHDEAGLLIELLTPKLRPRSPLNNSHAPLGRTGSLRRSRNSSSGSPSAAAERELSTLLGMTAALDPKASTGASPSPARAQWRGGGEARKASPVASPESGQRSPGLSPLIRPRSQGVAAHGFPQNQQPRAGETAPQTPSSPSRTSGSPENIGNANTHHTTTAYLNQNATRTGVDAIEPTSKVTVKPTSDPDQQSDRNNNSTDQLGRDFSSQTDFDLREKAAKITETAEKSKAEPDFSGQIACSDDESKPDAVSTNNMTVILEKRTLVPELQAFNEVAEGLLHDDQNHRLHGYRQDDVVTTDLEEEGMDKSQTEEADENSRIENFENSEEGTSESRSASEGKDEKVVVWCVTGVCEAADELTHTEGAHTLPHTRADNTHEQIEKGQGRSNNQEENKEASCIPANHTPSEPQPANEQPVPVPISSQPVPVSRCDYPSFPASSANRPPAEPAAANETPAPTADASEEAKRLANQRREAEGSTNENRGLENLHKRPTDEKSKNETAPRHAANERTEADSSTNEKREPLTSSKLAAKTLPSKARPAGFKPSTLNSALPSRPQPVRTLTSSENQGMRRVVPISKPSRGVPSLGKRLEKPPGHHQGGSGTSNPNNASLRRGEKPSTAPSSRRSSLHKEPKDLKDQKVSGVMGSAREQIQALQRRPSVRKPAPKPKPQPEEKMCRSTLRALAQAGVGGGGGGSVSAPVTPSHQVTTPASSAPPGFARSTAASSFRRTHTTLTPPATPHSPHGGSDSSPKTSPKASSSSLSGASPFIRTGSLRVSKSSFLLPSSSSSSSSPLIPPAQDSPLRRSQSIRAPPRSPLHDPLAPPKGHRRNDSGSFSDKSAHSRDSGKASKPSWR
ncbi:FH2 domain-containing protein 1-like [Centroberyx affinis]|uniref:FH2 domain-containing protein 1-like n=1 Tax=Centroberyx affinis TaxID=166261 RepID=UPI003A5C1F6A